jgi:hypothetical protein
MPLTLGEALRERRRQGGTEVIESLGDGTDQGNVGIPLELWQRGIVVLEYAKRDGEPWSDLLVVCSSLPYSPHSKASKMKAAMSILQAAMPPSAGFSC